MQVVEKWRLLGLDHPVWELLQLFQSVRTSRRAQWIQTLNVSSKVILQDGTEFTVTSEVASLLVQYLEQRALDYRAVSELLRTEEEALAHCLREGVTPGTTRTRSQDHHQSSKSLVAGVTAVALRCGQQYGIQVEPNPQSRCDWISGGLLHVTARNLDGAVPSLLNPLIVWEIKEYWGQTQGGSKMSDAVYECMLVGRELRHFEAISGARIVHAVFVDGKAQWSARQADLRRFIDLFHQGLIDWLFVGREVEDQWEKALTRSLRDLSPAPGQLDLPPG